MRGSATESPRFAAKPRGQPRARAGSKRHIADTVAGEKPAPFIRRAIPDICGRRASGPTPDFVFICFAGISRREFVLKQQQTRKHRRLVRDAMVTGTLALTLAASFSVSSAHAHRAHGKHGAGHSRGTGGAGLASVYSDSRTASGEHMNAGAMTAAHRTLPFGTRVAVLNNHTGRSVVVRINDRGPFVAGRVIDLSPAAAHAIGVNGLAPVSLRVVGRA